MQTRPASSCATLIPTEWRAGVPGAAIPAGDTSGEWVAFADAQTGQLEKANDRTRASIEIVERCDARDAAVVERLTPKAWWKFWS